MVACLRNFMAEVTWPWAPTQMAICLVAIFWILGYHESLLGPWLFW